MRHFICTLLIAFCALAAFAQDVDSGYVIDQYIYHAQVHADNSWTVTEELDVTFLEPRHGIYRHIPRRYAMYRPDGTDTQLYNYCTTVEDIRVDGEHVELIDNDDSEDNIILRIGDADRIISGPHTYTIAYTLRKPDDRWTGGDELFHTILPPLVNTTIGRLNFRIDFDGNVPPQLAQHLKVHSGPWGSEKNALSAQVSVTKGSVTGSLDSIAPYQGLAIYAPLQEGYWQGAPAQDSTTAYVLLAITGIIFAWLLRYFMTHHRYRPTVVYEYAAPDDLSSAEVGTIIDDSADLSDLTSLIVWWASKGYVKIVETAQGKKASDSRIELVRLTDLPASAPDYQKHFWGVFFATNDRVDISDLGDRHEEIATAMMALKQHFKGARSLTAIQLLPLLVWALFVGIGTAAFITSSAVATFYPSMLLAALLCFTAPTAVMGLIRIWASARDMLRSDNARTTRGIIYVALAAANVWVFARLFYNAPDSLVPLGFYIALIAAGWMMAFFAGDLVADSAYRLQKMSLLLGFRDFIEKSELPMLKAQVDENPNYFYDILPYAMVFGLTKKWNEQFAALNIAPPSWYEAQGMTPGFNPALNFNAAHFAQHLTTDFSKSISQAVAASSIDPTSHNSSGGGFSGGGGGGGGVGSW